MLKRLLVAAALAGSALAVPMAASLPASAAVQAHASAASCYKQSGNHWVCITPGAYCSKTAHSKYGYAKVTNRKYKCSQYSNKQWRWKRV